MTTAVLCLNHCCKGQSLRKKAFCIDTGHCRVKTWNGKVKSIYITQKTPSFLYSLFPLKGSPLFDFPIENRKPNYLQTHKAAAKNLYH